MRTLHAIILAAGEGIRMKSETPKVLHPICGRPMIAYALDLAASAGVKQPIIVLGHGADAIKTRLPKEVKVVLQTKRLGTGDAVIAAKKALGTGGSVLILYADTPLLRRTTVQKLIESHFKTGATCTLLTAHLADPSGYGRLVRNEHGQITEIVEEGEANSAQRAIREINVGPLVCQVQPLLDALAVVTQGAAKKEIYLTDIISHVARQEGTKIHAARVEEASEAVGVNSRLELARAISVIRQRIVEAHLANGVTIEDPQTTSIDHGVTIGVDTVIHPNTVIETGVSIGKRCSIGPFARIRSGVSIAEEVRVGNFVELVRSKVGPRVRVNHVSYLGDAIVEEQANIGAGTITANYDGQAKHQTHIGKGAFIGSDTILIAPVKVGAGAVTGAGSVIPKDHDVPAKGVVVGVPARPLNHRATEEDGKVKVERPAAVSRPLAQPVRLRSGRRPERRRGTQRPRLKRSTRGTHQVKRSRVGRAQHRRGNLPRTRGRWPRQGGARGGAAPARGVATRSRAVAKRPARAQRAGGPARRPKPARRRPARQEGGLMRALRRFVSARRPTRRAQRLRRR